MNGGLIILLVSVLVAFLVVLLGYKGVLGDEIVVAVCVIAFFGFLTGLNTSLCGTFNTNCHTITINEKMQKNNKYMIFGEEDGEDVVFTDVDSFFRWKWDSSDVYARLKVGKTYKVKTNLRRVKFLSWYENILEVEEVK